MNEKFDIKEKRLSILDTYGENFLNKTYVTNPAIGRDAQIKELILTLLTPDKSAVLVGKPGVGKTAIVEGLAYRIQKGLVPDGLMNFQVIRVNTSALLGVDPTTGEAKVQTLIDEIKARTNLILFIDEIHTLIGKEESLDFANMFKPALDRGDIKVIGATTTDEYERYILRDKAFVRRFQKIDVAEPTRDENVEILIGTLPKIEKKTGARLMYSSYVQRKIMEFITDITSEYKRIYELDKIPVRFINNVLNSNKCLSSRSTAWIKTVMEELGWKKGTAWYKATDRNEMCWKRNTKAEQGVYKSNKIYD